MAKCANCDGLVGAGKGTGPHPELVPVHYKLYPTHGEHHGLMTSFQCTACGTLWILDKDAHDPRAGWSEGSFAPAAEDGARSRRRRPAP